MYFNIWFKNVLYEFNGTQSLNEHNFPVVWVRLIDGFSKPYLELADGGLNKVDRPI